MNPILAENIDGWLFAAAAFLGGVIASVLALCAIVPARHGRGALTLAMTAPALVVALLVTVGCIYGFVTDGLHNPDYSLGDFAIPWLIGAGPSLATSLLAMLVLWLSKRRSRLAHLDGDLT